MIKDIRVYVTLEALQLYLHHLEELPCLEKTQEPLKRGAKVFSAQPWLNSQSVKAVFARPWKYVLQPQQVASALILMSLGTVINCLLNMLETN